MRNNGWMLFFGVAAVASLFLSPYFTILVMAAFVGYVALRLGAGTPFKAAFRLITTVPQSEVPETPEATIVTAVINAPHEVLGVDKDAGTDTIFHSFHQLVKEEQGIDMRLTRRGRRLQAAKKTLLSYRRKIG